MNILHLVESYSPAVGGMPEVVQRISEGLVAANHNVTVATSYHPQRESNDLRGVRIDQFAIRGNYSSGISGAEQEIARFKALLLDARFDIITIYAAQHWAADIALQCLPSIRAKTVFVPTGFSALRNPHFADYYREMGAWLLKFDMNVFLSNTYQDIEFARAVGAKNTLLIPNGASQIEFETQSTLSFRREKNLAPATKLLLLVGSHTGEKGHFEAIQVFKKLKTTNVALVIAANVPDYFAQIVAAKTIKQRLKILVKHLLSPFVKRYRLQLRCPRGCLREARTFNRSKQARRQRKWLFVDSFSRAEVVALYKEADLFIFPSNIECSPIVLFEALAGKTPFLASAAGNSGEIAEWTKGGMILPSVKDKYGRTEVDIMKAAQMTDWLLSDDKARIGMANAGHKAWLDRFTWEKIIQQYADLYARLLAGKAQ